MRKTSVVLIFVLVGVISSIAIASEGYVFVADRGAASKVSVYQLNGDNITYSKTIDIGRAGTWGVIDITIDEASQIAFVSCEQGNYIKLVDTYNKSYLKDIVVDEIYDVTGLVYDASRSKLLAIERDTNVLYEFNWNNADLELELNRIITLSDIDYANGIAINQNTLYVTRYNYGEGILSSKVRTYDISNNYLFAGLIDMTEDAIGIAYDPNEEVLYGGAYTGNSENIIKYSPSTSSALVKNTGDNIIGFAIDKSATSRIITTNRNGGSVALWDTSEWTSGSAPNVSPLDSNSVGLVGPAGLAYINNDLIPNGIGLEITDNIDPSCISPGDSITYTVVVDPNNIDHEDLTVSVIIPEAMDYDDPLNINYDVATRTYTWEIGTLNSTDLSVSKDFSGTINYNCEPGVTIYLHVNAESNVALASEREYTDVCCEWGGDIVYVDDSAIGFNTGTSWENAYTDLRKALKRISDTGCAETAVWVAGGVYWPGNNTTYTFDIPDGVEVYGGMKGDEDPNEPLDDPSTRDYIQYKSVLTGNNKNDIVVTMGNNSKLHGFTIKDGKETNVYGDGVNYTIEYCIVSSNDKQGIYCNNGNLTVNWCIVSGNGFRGIYHEGSGKTLTVTNCKIYDNVQDGIYANSSTPTILNSEIHHNGSDPYVSYYGIRLYSVSAGEIRNCTIVYNDNYGIYRSGGTEPDISNCIFWGNNDNGTQFYNCSVTESYTSDPVFAYTNPDLGNYHILTTSPVKDWYDDTSIPAGETDIDGEGRVYNTNVDLGSDEVSADCTDDAYIANNLFDINADGLVNNFEFAIFADAWLVSDPNFFDGNPADEEQRAAWIKARRCNFDKTDTSQHKVDIDDLMYLANNWLWQACWKNLEGPWMMAMRGMGQGMFLESMSLSQATAIAKPEPTIEEQIEQAESNIKFLEDVWENNEEVRETIDEDRWEEIIESIEESIEELEEEL